MRSPFRRLLLKRTPEELEARFEAIPNPVMRERQRQSVLQGIDARHVTTALRNYDKFIGEMEETLARSPYIGGDSIARRRSSLALCKSRGDVGDRRAVGWSSPACHELVRARAAAGKF